MYGEVIFFTVSPNRRHSSLLLKLARVRREDVGVKSTDEVSKARRKFAGSDSPSIFYPGTVDDDDADIEEATTVLELPSLATRQAINAQDPLSSVHHYLVAVYVLLPAAFGLRMCLRCPHCNIDQHDPANVSYATSCQDVRGNNAKPIGGVGGLAQALALATEFQGEGTPHGHGFVALCNAYQHRSLQDIADLIKSGAHELSSSEIVERIKSFCEHLQREDHFDDDKHQADIEQLEAEFHRGNEGPRSVYLSARPEEFYKSGSVPTLWSESLNADIAEVYAEAIEFKRKYERDVQFVFSRVQHHWHNKGKDGSRVPMKYCKAKGNLCKQGICKRGFPKKVLRDKFGKARHDRYKTRVVCSLGYQTKLHDC